MAQQKRGRPGRPGEIHEAEGSGSGELERGGILLVFASEGEAMDWQTWFSFHLAVVAIS